MITEKQIEGVITKLEDENFEDTFAIDQPEYWHYLNSENFKALNEEEHQLLHFVNSVIYHSINSEDFDFDLEEYEAAEEKNWTVRDKNKSWSDTKDIFFENYFEEDLLAFIEDMLASEAEDSLSEIGQEVIFITSKSYIDSFQK